MDSIAYHLRQDGTYFPITAHIYCSGDGSLMGEAEAAEFILVTKSAGSDVAKLVLDTWIGLMILKFFPMAPDNLDVDRFIIPSIKTSQSLMEYRLSDSDVLELHQALGNYSTIGELKQYLTSVDIDTLQTEIMTTLNQQFCRVRYGGIYDSHGDPELWIRISSAGVSWTNTLYLFVSEFKNIQKVEYVTICRDRTSPSEPAGNFGGGDENVKIYKAADGALYLHMPIEEYLSEVHDTRDIFTTTDIDWTIRDSGYKHIWGQLCSGKLLHNILAELAFRGEHFDIANTWSIMTAKELHKCN